MKVKFFIVKYTNPPEKEEAENLLDWASNRELVGSDEINEFIQDKKVIDIKLSCFTTHNIAVCVMYEED